MTTPLIFTTQTVPDAHRADWLQDVIGREYTKVTVTPPQGRPLFNEMTIYPWDRMRLSSIRSNPIRIDRGTGDPLTPHQDSYFAVLLRSGCYVLSQDGRDAVLSPGDMAFYDAARPHRIVCDGPFEKTIVSVPRRMMRDAVPMIASLTATRVPSTAAPAALARQFLGSVTEQAPYLDDGQFGRLSALSLDLLAMTAGCLHTEAPLLSTYRSTTLWRVKGMIEHMLPDGDLDSQTIARAAGMSSRYLRDLFADLGTSPMRHVWDRRLDRCRDAMANPVLSGKTLSEIAFCWGFNDLAHFSRAFKRRFGQSPRDYRATHSANKKGVG
jgi:AraC-like DNA-binding protein